MRKKLFAVIMSVMMMVTFMPMMAFAGEAVYTYSSDFRTLFRDGIPVAEGAAPVFQQDTGKMKVNYSGTYDSYDVEYYDFTNAYFKPNFTLEADEYLDMINQDSKVKDPTFATGKNIGNLLGSSIYFVNPKDSDVVKGVAYTTFANDVDFSNITLPRYEAYEDVASLAFKLSPVAMHNNHKDATNYVMNVDKMKVDYSRYLTFARSANYIKLKLTGSPIYQYNRDTHKFGNCTEGTLNTVYCGENQNIEVLTKNITLKYSTDFGKTWTDTVPEMKDVKDYKFYFKAFRGTTEIAPAQQVTVKVAKAPLSLTFKTKHINLLPGQKVTAADVITFKTFAYDEKGNMDAVDVFAADKTVADKIFASCVELKDFPTQTPVGGTPVTLLKGGQEVSNDRYLKSDCLNFVEIVNKIEELVNNDLDVAKFFENYDVEDGIFALRNNLLINTAEVTFGVAYNDVTAPNQTKTYHIKNRKALKSNHTLQLKATADYGTMSFTKMSGNSKVKVASNGKVTVKKGLKKGKYVVKVKVKAPGAAAIKKLTVRVVK